MNKRFNFTMFALLSVALHLFIYISGNLLLKMEWYREFQLDFFNIYLFWNLTTTMIYTGLLLIFYLKCNIETKFGTMFNTITLICTTLVAVNILITFSYFALGIFPYFEILFRLMRFIDYDYLTISVTLFSLGIFFVKPKSNTLKYLALLSFILGVVNIMTGLMYRVMHFILSYRNMPDAIYSILTISVILLLVSQLAMFGYMCYLKVGPKELQPNTNVAKQENIQF